MIGSITVGAAALTTLALRNISQPEILSLIPGGFAGRGMHEILKDGMAREWIRGKYAKFLGKIGKGPFRFTHTWRAHRIIDNTKTNSTK